MAYIDLQHQDSPLHLASVNFNLSIRAVEAASNFLRLTAIPSDCLQKHEAFAFPTVYSLDKAA
jgi:hypothetical protein